MRKYILYLFTILLVAACSDDNDNANSPSHQPGVNPRVMNFGVPAITRAAGNYISGSTLPRDSSIGVFAFNQGSHTWDDMGGKTTANLMYNQKMTYTGGTALSYNPLRYWIPDSVYSFFAYYPYSATGSNNDGITIDTTNIGTGKGAGTIVYNTPANAKDQTDLLVTDIITDLKAPSSDVDSMVKFHFRHALAGLRYKVDLSKSNVTNTIVTSFDVTMNNIYTGGSLATTKAGGITTQQWTPTKVGNVSATGCSNDDATKDNFLLIPQTFPDSASIVADITTGSGSHVILTDYLGSFLNSIQQGFNKTLTLQPDSTSDAKAYLVENDGSITFWKGHAYISSSHEKLELRFKRLLRNYLVSQLKAGSTIRVDWSFTGWSGYNLTIALGDDDDIPLSSKEYSTSDVTYEVYTLTQDDVDKLKRLNSNWSDSETFFSISTTDSEDVVAITKITITP